MRGLALVLTGGTAGLMFGYVLLRANLCFHSVVRGLFEGRRNLAKAWLLGVTVAAVGLTTIFSLGLWPGLSRGLPFRPIGNIGGGIIFGIGMVIAASCVSGLFYKLGAGMLGAAAGLLGWAGGELTTRNLPAGPTLLAGGDDATLAGVLGVSRWVIVVPIAVLVIALLARSYRRDTCLRGASIRTGWAWPRAGAALGLATIAAWVLAGIGGASFGPSTVGAVNALAAGHPNLWLTAFLLGIIAGAFVTARLTGSWRPRLETRVRYVQLLIGGYVLGFGGSLAGGCNLGHALSGAAQLSVSSFVTVAAIVTGVGIARAVQPRLMQPVTDWRPNLSKAA